MKRRNFLKGAAVAGAAASSVAAPALAQGKMQWRLATFWKTDWRVYRQVEAFAKLVADGSDGRLSIVNIETLGVKPIKPTDILSRVADGTVEMGHGLPHLWAGAVPAAKFLARVPFGLTTQETNCWLQFGDGQALADEAFASAGAKFLPAGNTGCQMGGWFKREIDTPADLKGLRMRITGLGAAVMKAAGAKPVSLLWGPAIAKALKEGDVDAAEVFGPSVDMFMGMHKLAKFYYYPGWHEPSELFALVINKSKWDALPASLKAVVESAAASLNHRVLGHYIVGHGPALATLVDEHGVQLKRFPDEVLKALARHAAEVLPAEASKDPLSQKMFDSVMAFRKDTSGWASVSVGAYVAARAMGASQAT